MVKAVKAAAADDNDGLLLLLFDDGEADDDDEELEPMDELVVTTAGRMGGVNLGRNG